MVDVPEEEQNRAMVVGSGITSAEIVQNRTVHGLVLENWLENIWTASEFPFLGVFPRFSQDFVKKIRSTLDVVDTIFDEVHLCGY